MLRRVLHPNNPHHFRYLPQTAHDIGEVQAVIHLQGEMQAGIFAFMGEVDILDATLSSAGDLNAFGLEVREAEVSASSAGDADISVSERLRARASSAGDINYRGNPKYIDAHSSSAGGVNRK